jgi:hypothetical protein
MSYQVVYEAEVEAMRRTKIGQANKVWWRRFTLSNPP